jgi:Cdc6-like AAA superfamily ATPase
MGTMPWSFLIRSSFTAYQKRHLLQHLWKNLLTFSDLGKTNIVVLGRPAVGKSVLASKLYGEANDFSWNNEVVNTNLGGTDIERELFRELITKIAEFSK